MEYIQVSFNRAGIQKKGSIKKKYINNSFQSSGYWVTKNDTSSVDRNMFVYGIDARSPTNIQLDNNYSIGDIAFIFIYDGMTNNGQITNQWSY